MPVHPAKSESAGARANLTMKIIKAMSDRLLKLFLSDVSAGACVPSHGECCSRGSRKYHSCYGTCVASCCCP